MSRRTRLPRVAATINTMSKGGGKGKLSNGLVAASCAAVLAVYAAGYSRTRDAARRFETHARQHRLAVQTTPTVPVVSAVPAAPVTSAVPMTLAAPAQPAGAAGPESAVIEASAPQSDSDSGLAAAQGSAAATAPVTRAAPKSSSSAAGARKPAPTAAVSSGAVAAASSSPGGLAEIAPVPLPLPSDDAVAKPIAIRRDPAFAPGAKWRDGTYTGLGDSPHGDVEVRVVIKEGRIVEAGISTCGTRYSCDVIAPLIQQPVARQSPDIDYMSHATESSDAYYDALVAALRDALEPSSSDAATPK